jgi:hypothetical protein
VIDDASMVSLRANQGDRALSISCVADEPAEWWRVVAPGAPGGGQRSFWITRSRAREGRVRIVWSWSGAVQRVEAEDDMLTVHLAGGARHVHSASEDGWHVDVFAGASRTSIDLAGLVDRSEMPDSAQEERRPSRRTEHELTPGTVLRYQLGEEQYRRSEQSWEDAGRPTAMADLSWDGRELGVVVHVAASERTFVPADAENELDNEHADINGDGVQLYLNTGDGRSAWVLVPESDGSVRSRVIEGWDAPRPVRASWHVDGKGYVMNVQVEVAEVIDEKTLALDLIVNEKPAGRMRRRGQLVLSGSNGDFVYLRGDRQDINRLLPFRLTNV